MFLRRVTAQMAYPALAYGSSSRWDMRRNMPLGTMLPGPPWMYRSVFGPVPQVRYSIPFANVPLRDLCSAAGALAMKATPVHERPGASLPGNNLNVTAAAGSEE